MKTNIRVHLTYIFTIGFFILAFLMFWIEASDSVNMKKGENSFTNEINILIGVIVASIGIIFKYWFNPRNSSNETTKTHLEVIQKLENSRNLEIVEEVEEIYEEEASSEESTTSRAVENTYSNSLELPSLTTNYEETKTPESGTKALESGTKVHIAFSALFFVGYFALLFVLLYLEFFASKKIVEGEDSLIDILLILIGVLTMSMGQILNYWFSKENRPAHDDVSKALFDKLISRPSKSLKKKVTTDSPPNRESSREDIPVEEPVQEDIPVEEPVQEDIPIEEPVQRIQPIEEPVQRIQPVVEPVQRIQPVVEPVQEIQPIAQPVQKIQPVVEPVQKATSGEIHPNLSFLLGLKGVSRAIIEQISPFVEEFEQKYGINTPLRKAHFYAQLAHESASFQRITENLNYSAKRLLQVFPKYFPTSQLAEKYASKPELIANRVYSNRMQNGNEASGDGYRYRGRGFIQMTGKANYDAFSKSIGVDFINSPDLLLQPQYLLEAAGWFWNNKNLNIYADKDDILTITKRINGGTHGLPDRADKVKQFKRALKA